ncbi:MAG: ATP-binding protein [Gammaproteobacteria bacterium]|nr:MAG: ATP-binding protein [Gammaproteobacteria bacterium]
MTTDLQHALPHLSSPHNLRRLVWLRIIVIPGAAIALLVASRFYQLPIRIAPLVTILGVLALVNFWTWQRLRGGREIPHAEFFAQMLVDVLALTGILYYSGGSTNPFAYLFLLPLAISATVLPRRYTWPMAAITAVCYTFLLVYRVPLPPFSPPENGSGFVIHVVGMWLGFVLSAVLIAQFVVSMGETLRDQERSLAEARERALRDERVVAVATLAAGAAHELSTPLATMALLTTELAEEYPSDRYPELHERIEVLRGQIRKCKESLSVISAGAGADRADAARPIRVDAFIRHAVSEVHRLRPGARIAVRIEGERPAPEIVVERTLTQALLNILHNAVDASPAEVRVICDWNGDRVRIDVADHGPGISLGALRPGSRPARSTKDSGLGLGLFLTHTALSHLGGEISFADAPGGGALVSVQLPLARQQTGAST